MKVRRQLTLFIPMPEKAIIECVRQTIDPMQFERISAHITLGYDDELQELENVLCRLKDIAREEIHFEFLVEGPSAFEAERKGIYLKISDKDGRYELIRKKLLGTQPPSRGILRPHLTLLHPRHARDAMDGWDIAKAAEFPVRLVVDRISLIELHGSRWETVSEF
jgi:2'-5' RNA ligase